MICKVSYGCWRGTPSAFGRFRCLLARAAGIPLGLMEGFCRPMNPIDYEDLRDWRKKFIEGVQSWLPLSWEPFRGDALVVLLHRMPDDNDWGGEIEAAQCAPLADRMEALLPKIERLDGGAHLDTAAKARRFIDGLRRAAARGKPVVFH